MKKVPPRKTMNYIANYHTHTYRCGHARGEDREYVEEAIKAGIQILGFSDHAPMPFPSGHHSGYRVQMKDAENYFASIYALKKEYQKDISIHIGVEAEFYPDTFDLFWDYIKQFPLEYMILGQHFIKREEDGLYSGAASPSEEKLIKFTDNIIAAIESGKFLYIAHPDILSYTGDEEAYRREMTRLCKAAKDRGVPLEINRLGFFEHRIYPSDRFFQIAGEVGCDAIIGSDAHSPDVFRDHASIEGCAALAKKHGLNLLPSIPMPKEFTKQ